MVWANDNRTLFYTTKDALDRPNKLWRSVIGDASEDELVFHEVLILQAAVNPVAWVRFESGSQERPGLVYISACCSGAL